MRGISTLRVARALLKLAGSRGAACARGKQRRWDLLFGGDAAGVSVSELWLWGEAMSCEHVPCETGCSGFAWWSLGGMKLHLELQGQLSANARQQLVDFQAP